MTSIPGSVCTWKYNGMSEMAATMTEGDSLRCHYAQLEVRGRESRNDHTQLRGGLRLRNGGSFMS